MKLPPWVHQLNQRFEGHARIYSIPDVEPCLIDNGEYHLTHEEQQSLASQPPPKLNDKHALFSTPFSGVELASPKWEYKSTDYATVQAKRRLSQKPLVISANGVIVLPEQRQVLLHLRSDISATYPSCLHTIGGAHDPNPIKPDLKLSRTMLREVSEETGLWLPESKWPMILAQEVPTGFIQCVFLGVVSAKTADFANFEGKTCTVSFDLLEDELLRNSAWVPSGLMHVLAWLALGAPGAPKARFGELDALSLYASVMKDSSSMYEFPIIQTTEDKPVRHPYTPHRFGIIAALPKEFDTVKEILEDMHELPSPPNDPNQYLEGVIPSHKNGSHRVIATLLDEMGTNSATLAVTNLFRSFPEVKTVILVGIAGGVPNPTKSAEHVRLGDVVVSDQDGVLQYDFGKLSDGHIDVHATATKPSRELIYHARCLSTEIRVGECPGQEILARIIEKFPHCKRPNETEDILHKSGEDDVVVEHPIDNLRKSGQPRIHFGRIGSANIVLKDSVKRDALRDDHRIRAVEMEGAGVAYAAWVFSRQFMVVRGICDYCDKHKSKEWQGYACAAASSYLRALLERVT